MAGKIWTPLGGWYHASKFAVEGFSDCLRLETQQFGIDVTLIEPGGQCTINDVSNCLGIRKRTLQRKLADEDTTFQKQLNHLLFYKEPFIVAAVLIGIWTVCILEFSFWYKYQHTDNAQYSYTPANVRR